MRVLYYHQHFSTRLGSAGTRSYEFSRKLIAEGHSVTMVCGTYNSGATGLTGSFVNGARRGVVDGIDVIEFELPYGNSDGFLKRSITFLKYALRSCVVSLREDYDIVFATTTPLTAGIPGILAKWVRRKPFVFEVRDLWPELPKAMGVIKNPLVLFAMRVLEKTSYRSADACIGLAPGIVNGIKAVCPKKDVHLIPNACDLDLFNPEAAAHQQLDRLFPELSESDFVAAFTGTHGAANGLESMLDVARELKRRGQTSIKLVFVGDGAKKPALMKSAKDEGLSNCIFYDG